MFSVYATIMASSLELMAISQQDLPLLYGRKAEGSPCQKSVDKMRAKASLRRQKTPGGKALVNNFALGSHIVYTYMGYRS